jgi:hypothetical protein
VRGITSAARVYRLGGSAKVRKTALQNHHAIRRETDNYALQIHAWLPIASGVQLFGVGRCGGVTRESGYRRC